MISSKRQAGVTLIELIVAISIFIVLALASGTLYAMLSKVYLKNQVTQDIQREGDAVLAEMSRNIKEATQLDVVQSNLITNPNTLTVRLKSGSTRKYYVATGQLHYVDENGVDKALLEPGTTVTSLTYGVITGTDGLTLKSVSINGTLSRTKNRQTVNYPMVSSVEMRPQ